MLDRLRGKEIDIYYDRRDLSVIYLFLEGALVGEAYCVEFGGRRVSLWEAQAEQRADRLQAARAAATSLEGRQRIQQEATAGRRLLSLEAKRLEQQRHLDQQRAEIHPAHTQAVLHALAEHQTPPSPLAPLRTGLLPPAIPEDEETDAPVVHLPVRPLEETHD